MQACPYDALYIDPETRTAAKCNYCAHRVDIGLEPACVNVCPEHAIISGDLDNPDTEIAQLIGREQVTVRKPEKGTYPTSILLMVMRQALHLMKQCVMSSTSGIHSNGVWDILPNTLKSLRLKTILLI